MIPGTCLIWSSILRRLNWRYSEFASKMETTRKRIKRGVLLYILKCGGYVIRYPDFEDKYQGQCNDDGVHLSYIGNDIC